MNKFFNIVINEAARFNVPPSWIEAIIQTESGGNPASIGQFDCSRGECSYGLMGIKLTTARGIDPSASVQDLTTPGKNIEIATAYLAQLRRRFSSAEDVFAYYKGGHPWASSSLQAKREVKQALRAAGVSSIAFANNKYGGTTSAEEAALFSGIPSAWAWGLGIAVVFLFLKWR